MNNPLVLILMIVIPLFLIGAIAIIVEIKKGKLTVPTPEQIRAMEDSRLEYEPEYTEMEVEVIDLACEARSVGQRLPRVEKEFRVAFKKESGECFVLIVSEEMYLAFEVGQRGSLTLVDGEFYSFLATEDI